MKSTFLIALVEQVLYAYINFKFDVGEIPSVAAWFRKERTDCKEKRGTGYM
jgi:hypothetical protein